MLLKNICESDQRPRECSRKSLLHLPTAVVLAALSFFNGKIVEMLQPVEQPGLAARSVPYDPDGRTPPPADMDMETLMEYLTNPEELRTFLQYRTASTWTDFPAGFVRSFRRSPEEFQQAGWCGPCNNFAEFAGEWGARHGCKMYIVSMHPKGVFAPAYQTWHQVAVGCAKEGERYFVIDGNAVMELDGPFDGYMQTHYPEMTIPPIGGILDWRRTKPNFVARIADHLRPNAPFMAASPALATAPPLTVQDPEAENPE